MNELGVSKPTSLQSVLKLSDDSLFTEPMLAHALGLLVSEAGHIVPDVESDGGRKDINKLSRAIGGAIKRLDERRAQYVAELKRRPAEIDKVFREVFRGPAEVFKVRVRKPLDDWDEAQRAAEVETDRLLAELNAPVEAGTSAQAVAARLEQTVDMYLPDWLGESQRAAVATAMSNAVPRLQAALASAQVAEDLANEVERLRAVEREAEIMRAREQAAAVAAAVARAEAIAEADQRAMAADQRAREAADRAEAELRHQEQARQDADRRAMEAEATAKARADAAAQAERDRIASEQAAAQRETTARENDREYKRGVHREIIADLCDAGFDPQQAQQIVIAIASGRIAHVRIVY